MSKFKSIQFLVFVIQITANFSTSGGFIGVGGCFWTEAFLMDTHTEWRSLMRLYPATSPHLVSLFPWIVIP